MSMYHLKQVRQLLDKGYCPVRVFKWPATRNASDLCDHSMLRSYADVLNRKDYTSMAKGKAKTRARRKRIHRNIRQTIQGTSGRPRLSVYRSNNYIYAQLIDDWEGHTLVSASSQEDGIDAEDPVGESHAVGRVLAERAEEAGIDRAVFDRSGYKYHGRVKALAEGAREGGLQL